MKTKEAKELINVSINELISLASYSIEENTVPPYDFIVKKFSDTWADMYLDEELKEKEGKHCYIIWDNCCSYAIRAIVVADDLDENVKRLILDMMDNVIFDLIYPDALGQITGEEIVGGAYSPNFNGDYKELLNYIDTNEQAMNAISDYEYSWLQVLVNGRLDLVTLQFKER